MGKRDLGVREGHILDCFGRLAHFQLRIRVDENKYHIAKTVINIANWIVPSWGKLNVTCQKCP